MSNVIETLLRVAGVTDGSSGGGGGGSAVLVDKTITANGEYDPADDNADGYSGVTVNVPNTYAAGDEGKVVSNGALVSQTSQTVTENGTYNTTTKNSVTVNVPSSSPTLTTKTITENGTYAASADNADGYSSVTVNVSGGGGGVVSVPEKDVNFYDYDGTCVNSYTAAEFANLTELPANPTHTGLTAQGWNWSLADAKTYVADCGRLAVGHSYITSDGKTRVYIHLNEVRLEPYLGFAVDGTAVVDWGDGSAETTVTGDNAETVVKTKHEYDTPGDYTISISVNGTMAIIGGGTVCTLLSNNKNTYADAVYSRSVMKVEMGANCVIGSSAFRACYGLSSISIPVGATIGGAAFASCYNLASVTVPSGVTGILGSSFTDCTNLRSASIPKSVTNLGIQSFKGCRSLRFFALTPHVTSAGDVFTDCTGLSAVAIPSDLTELQANMFKNCCSLPSVKMPNSITTLGTGSVFYGCYSLSSANIPSGLTAIPSSLFYGCRSLSSITVPSNITSIGANTFRDCYGMAKIRFERETPPTVSGTTAFQNVQTDCIIEVPAGSLEAYTTATNYPNPSTYTYVEY